MALFSEPNNSGLLAKVKNAFLTMASPSGYGGDNSIFCSISTVNIPPMAARAVAAYEAGCRILRSNLFALDDEGRKAAYAEMAALFRCASDLIVEADLLAKKSGKKISLDEMKIYFAFLADIIEYLYAAIIRQLAFTDGNPVFKEMLGRALLAFNRSPDEILEDFELRQIHFITDFVNSNENQIRKSLTKLKHLMPAPEQERFSKAYKEYVAYYSKK